MSRRKSDPNQADLFEADTRAYRYLMILNPGFHITEKVRFFREMLQAIYPVGEEEMRSRPHLTLCYFDSSYNCDDLMISRVKQAISDVRVFDLHVNGVDYWPTGTFFIKLEDASSVIQLTNNLKKLIKGVKTSGHPHITIVRKLKKQHYAGLRPEDLDFRISSPCSSVTILKQLLGDGSHPFQVLEKLKFRY